MTIWTFVSTTTLVVTKQSMAKLVLGNTTCVSTCPIRQVITRVNKPRVPADRSQGSHNHDLQPDHSKSLIQVPALHTPGVFVSYLTKKTAAVTIQLMSATTFPKFVPSTAENPVFSLGPCVQPLPPAAICFPLGPFSLSWLLPITLNKPSLSLSYLKTSQPTNLPWMPFLPPQPHCLFLPFKAKLHNVPVCLPCLHFLTSSKLCSGFPTSLKMFSPRTVITPCAKSIGHLLSLILLDITEDFILLVMPSSLDSEMPCAGNPLPHSGCSFCLFWFFSCKGYSNHFVCPSSTPSSRVYIPQNLLT